MGTDDCIFCKIDEVECSDNCRGPAYYLVGRNAPPDILFCDKHQSLLNMAVMVVGIATKQMDALAKIVSDAQKPKLKVVK